MLVIEYLNVQKILRILALGKHPELKLITSVLFNQTYDGLLGMCAYITANLMNLLLFEVDDWLFNTLGTLIKLEVGQFAFLIDEYYSIFKEDHGHLFRRFEAITCCLLDTNRFERLLVG